MSIDATTFSFPPISISGLWSNKGKQGCVEYLAVLHNHYAAAKLEYITCRPFTCLHLTQGYNEQCTESATSNIDMIALHNDGVLFHI